MTTTVQITYRQRYDHSQLRIDNTPNCSHSTGHHRVRPEYRTSPQ